MFTEEQTNRGMKERKMLNLEVEVEKRLKEGKKERRKRFFFKEEGRDEEKIDVDCGITFEIRVKE